MYHFEKIVFASFLAIFFYFVVQNKNFIFTWLESSKKEKKLDAPKPITSPPPYDIVLAALSSGENAILWNCVPGKNYKYSIIDLETNLHIVNSEITPQSSVAKVKNIPIVYGKKYEVLVGDTKIQAKFEYPILLEDRTIVEDTFAELRTKTMPTFVEIIKDGIKIEEKYIGIYSEPDPGVRVDYDLKDRIEIIFMLYNGMHVAYIMNI